MDESSAHRLGSLCLTTYCRESIGQVFRDLANTPSIMVRPSTLPLGEPNIAVYEKTFVRFSSRDAFHQWMALHAEGTTFSWPDQDRFDVVWVPSEERRLFEETRAFLESHRMTLTRPH